MPDDFVCIALFATASPAAALHPTEMAALKNILIVEKDTREAADVERLLLAGGCERVRIAPRIAAVPETMATFAAELLVITLEPEHVAEQLHAARELQQQLNLPIVFAVDATACVELSRLGGVQPSGYIVKPVEGRELWVVIDAVSRMRKIELRLHRLEERLREVQRLESIGVVAGWIAHDFNNLITGIYGAVALAGKELPDNSPARERLDHIERAAGRAAELCQRLMVPAGNSSNAKATLSLSEITEEAIKVAQEGCKPGIVIQTGFGVDLPPVLGVEAQLRQAVMNLLSNSFEAMAKGSGMIRVLTYSRWMDEAALAALTVPGEPQAGEQVVIEITDTGCGIPRDVIGRIFDPLFSTKGPGRGLGLAAVARIMRKHRGAVEVDSTSGHGTSMRLFFPAHHKSTYGLPMLTRSPLPMTPVAPATKLDGGRTVLVVDDDDAVRALARWVIEKAGHPVVTARDGDEAVRLFLADPGQFMLLFLDLTMPRMGGLEAMQKMRAVKPHQRVIIVTGHGESLLTEDLRGQDVDFLQKPFTPERLRLVLSKYTSPASA